MSDDCEREVFLRVLDALLREDHLGLLSRGRLAAPGWWEVPHTAGLLRIPVRADGFQQALRSAAPVVHVVSDRDTLVTMADTLDGLLTVLAPDGDVEAEAGWRDFAAECRADLRARRLATRARPRVLAAVAAERASTPTGMPAALLDDVLAAHQGHPVYPTDRCRHGLDDDDLLRYAPEHAPRFALRWYAAAAEAVTLAGDLPAWWPRAPRPDQLLMPAHPLTAARDALPVVDLPMISARPTLSMRTVALDHDPYLHLKVPLPTASLGARNRRTLHPGSLADGATVAGLLDRIATAEPAFVGRIRHADESTYAYVDGDERRGFLLRRFPRDLAGVRVVPVAALAAPDPVAGTVLERVSPGRPEALLESYLDLLLDWHVCLWLRHGIALEAHPQNIHLLVHPDGTVGLLYKDNDGARLDVRQGGAVGLELRDERMWARDPQELADVFITITLHLAAAAPLIALADRGLPVPSPAAALAPRLAAARDRWGDGPAARSFTERVLRAAHLPIKAMLTAGTLLPKQRLGCSDVNKYYRRTGPNYLRETR
ncbi:MULTISPECIES: IucA/IucC family protein [unclassified Micromonospora]|uniref:IucA/IucC family protein n=1 Tax=unclassified Micromonospora TaxID=2617518 RepID=UPI000EF4FA8A|nr:MULTISPECIES: IucA/IucC family siderophore biosynthesis protein [unclassified Micromonospora]RLP93848.1 IucA/IucC family siderophore biosynthesis protein [Micromonospora sp. BL4]RLP94807.1 IucA/IucC family siderophore biosynthesis protein [Micromonospora sp. CV4]